MLLTRLDDYQSWMVSHRGSCILIDPWLTPEPITGSFDREHTQFTTLKQLRTGGDDIAAVLLCTGVNDHTRPDTLRELRDVAVYGPARAAAIARKAGCSTAIDVRAGRSWTIACRDGGSLRVTVTRTGLPLGLIAVGYVIDALDDDGERNGRLWIEPHQPLRSVADGLSPIDIAILPCQGVTAVVMPVNSGARAVARAASAGRARYIVPTATDPGRDMSRWQATLYRVSGSTADVRARMSNQTAVTALAAGESLALTGSAT